MSSTSQQAGSENRAGSPPPFVRCPSPTHLHSQRGLRWLAMVVAVLVPSATALVAVAVDVQPAARSRR